MKRCPKIGSRVRVPEGMVVGACTGTVVAIYPTYVYDDVRDRTTNTPQPETEWHVGVKVDAPLPAKWCYVGTDRFAPQVSRLKRAQS